VGHAFVTLGPSPTDTALAEGGEHLACVVLSTHHTISIDTGNFISILQALGLLAEDSCPVSCALARVCHFRGCIDFATITTPNPINVNSVFSLAAHQWFALTTMGSAPSQVALTHMFVCCNVDANSIVVAVLGALGYVTKGPLPIVLALACQGLFLKLLSAIKFGTATIDTSWHVNASATVQPIPSNFTRADVGQFTLAIHALGVTDWLCAWKVFVFVVLLVLPACEALNLSRRVTNVAGLVLKFFRFARVLVDSQGRQVPRGCQGQADSQSYGQEGDGNDHDSALSFPSLPNS